MGMGGNQRTAEFHGGFRARTRRLFSAIIEFPGPDGWDLVLARQGACDALTNHKEHLAQWPDDCLGAGADPCDVACRSLRVFRVRGAAMLCAAEWAWRFPAAGTHAASAGLGEDLPHADPFFS